VDRYAQDSKIRVAYRVVTFAGRVAESALSSAKTTLSADGCVVKINVGWEERTNVVLARLYYLISRAVDSYELVLGSYSIVRLAEHLYLEVYSTFSAYPVDPSVDRYSTWHCLYQQQPHSRTCDPSRYR
jgi:hypothetical protein